MKYITKITIRITNDTAQDLINYYEAKKSGENVDAVFVNKSLELWKKSNDKQMIEYFENSKKTVNKEIDCLNQKINFLKSQMEKNKSTFDFDIIGNEFIDFKTNYLRDLHIEHNKKYPNPATTKNANQLSLLDYKNRKYFDKKEFPEKTFIPYCETDIYTKDVPECLLKALAGAANQKTIDCIMDEENNKKAWEAIKKDQKMEDAKQALIRKEEKQPEEKIKTK